MADAMDKDPREATLPRWAQQMLEALRSRVATAYEHMALQGATATARIIVDPYAHQMGKPRVPVMFPENYTVRFRIGKDLTGDFTDHRNVLDVALRRHRLQVSAPDGMLQLHPEAANVVTVTAGRIP